MALGCYLVSRSLFASRVHSSTGRGKSVDEMMTREEGLPLIGLNKLKIIGNQSEALARYAYLYVIVMDL